MVIRVKKGVAALLLLALIVLGIIGIKFTADHFYRQAYPKNFQTQVQTYADKYQVDPYFIWAVIKTESGFRPDATSQVGARGLMQLMEDTFHWVDSKIPDGGASYDDMYQPDENIRYGTYLLSYLYREFGRYDTAAAAYHAGRTAVSKWLRDTSYSSDGSRLDQIPSEDTGHYVSKVMKTYEIYQKLYANEKIQ